MMKILLVEDEVNISSFIVRGLTELGHEVCVAYDGAEGWQKLQDETFEMLILDVVMPGMDGLQLCQLYRQHYGYGVPVLMLTALSTTDDIVAGLQAGADDYLAKPFSFRELDARIMALSRRGENADACRVLECADLRLDMVAHQCRRAGEQIELTVKEYRLLEYFLQHQGEAISRRTLLREVWDKNFDTNTNVVDVYVNYLRGKIDKDYDVKLIHTIMGVGYIFQPQ